MKLFLTVLSLFISIFVSAQNSTSTEFSPNGKPIIRVFSNFSTKFSNGAYKSGFEMRRAYLGYDYNFSKNISGRVVFDVANKSGLAPTDFTVFLKNAFARYSKDNFNASFGMIGTTGFRLAESVWGKRYMYKSLQDEYGFGSSADLGTTISYKFLPQLSADFSIFNGEGYKKVQVDSVLKFAAGITIEPIENLYIRVYDDYMKGASAQNTLSLFLGYKGSKASIGADYTYQTGHRMNANKDFTGLSAYGTYTIAKKISVFGRYDNVMSNKIGAATSGWNATDGQIYIAGLEYSPVKGIKITPNIRYADYTVGNASTNVFINFEMRL